MNEKHNIGESTLIKINNLDEMNQFAMFLVEQLKSGDLILLNGDLGAGKTTLTQFIGKALGVRRTINSPTFNIIKSYRGKNLKLHHMDCYRLEDSDEDLGFDEFFEDQAITVIEWSQFIKIYFQRRIYLLTFQQYLKIQDKLSCSRKENIMNKLRRQLSMNSLLIDTSNQPLSVALMQNDEVLAEITTDSKQNHSVQLMPAISQLFEQSKIAKQQLDAIIVAEGPGSYTGLRIGVTVAKTLAYALDVKLYGVSSLKALAATIDHTDKLLVPVFDARRQAVYTGIFQWQNGQLVTILEDQYMSIEALRAFLEDLNQPFIYIGKDTIKLQDELQGEVIAQLPNASVMYQLIDKPTDVHTFTPKYHKLAEAERNWINSQKNN